MARYEELYSLKRHFVNKLKLPGRGKVILRRVQMPQTAWADVDTHYCGKRYFTIRIHRDVNEQQAIELLVHEFAHILDWKPSTPWSCSLYEDHGISWGRKYSIVYRSYLKWMELSESDWPLKKVACARNSTMVC